MRWRKWQRVAGMGIVAVGLVMGAVVGLTMVLRFWSFELPTSGRLPDGLTGRDFRGVRGGVLMWDRYTNPPGMMWTVMSARPEPWSLKWEKREHWGRVNVPIWPVPLLTVCLGGAAWWNAARRAGRTRWPSAGRASRWVGAALLALAVVMGAAVWASFLGWGGWYSWDYDDRRCGVWRGVAFSVREKDWPQSLAKGLPPEPELLETEWTNDGEWWSYRVPVWPVPLVVLAAGVAVARRGERVWRASRVALCGVCGYDLCGLAAEARCPECGEGRRQSERESESEERQGLG